MSSNRKDVKLYNVLFPVWMLMLFPAAWLIVLPGNFLIDSLVLLLGMSILKIADRKLFYKKYIVKVFLFGLLSDLIGVAYMLILMIVFELGSMGDEWYMAVPAVIISAVFIFIFDYFVTFRKIDSAQRLKLVLLYAMVTAPYTFLVPSSWIYR